MTAPTTPTASDGRDPGETANRQIATAWRELRRLASSAEVRRHLYGSETPLDQGQSDALEYVVTHGPCRMGDLARHMRVDPSSATRAVERLEAAGLVAREPDVSDARAIRVAGTAEGIRVHGVYRARASALLDAALQSFTDAEERDLARLMQRLVGGIERCVANGSQEK